MANKPDPRTLNAAADGGMLSYLFDEKEAKKVTDNPATKDSIKLVKREFGKDGAVVQITQKDKDGKKQEPRYYKQIAADGKQAAFLEVDKDGKAVKDKDGNARVVFTNGGFTGDQSRVPGIVLGTNEPKTDEEKKLKKVTMGELNPELAGDSSKNFVNDTLAKLDKNEGIKPGQIKGDFVGHSMGAGGAMEMEYFARQAGVKDTKTTLLAPYKGNEQAEALAKKLGVKPEELSKNTTAIIPNSFMNSFMGFNNGAPKGSKMLSANTTQHSSFDIAKDAGQGKVGEAPAKGPGMGIPGLPGMPKLPGGMGANLPGGGAMPPNFDKMVMGIISAVLSGDVKELFASLMEGINVAKNIQANMNGPAGPGALPQRPGGPGGPAVPG